MEPDTTTPQDTAADEPGTDNGAALVTALDEAAVTTAQLAAGLAQLAAAVQQLGGLVVQLLNSRILCHRCHHDRAAAHRRGVQAQDLPPMAIANLIIAGKGVCTSHAGGADLLIPGH